MADLTSECVVDDQEKKNVSMSPSARRGRRNVNFDKHSRCDDRWTRLIACVCNSSKCVWISNVATPSHLSSLFSGKKCICCFGRRRRDSILKFSRVAALPSVTLKTRKREEISFPFSFVCNECSRTCCVFFSGSKYCTTFSRKYCFIALFSHQTSSLSAACNCFLGWS